MDKNNSCFITAHYQRFKNLGCWHSNLGRYMHSVQMLLVHSIFHQAVRDLQFIKPARRIGFFLFHNFLPPLEVA